MTQTKAELLQTRHQGDIRLGDADSSNYVGFKAPTTVGSNTVWTLPAADGSNGYALTTNGSGVLSWSQDASGIPASGGTFTGGIIFENDVTFDGATAGRDIIFDRSDNALEFVDNAKATFGTDSDLNIYHNGSHSFITNSGGDLVLGYSNIYLQAVSGENSVRCLQNGATELYYDAVKKLETTASGATVTGRLLTDGVSMGDNEELLIGTGNDLKLRHDGTDNHIATSNGDLNIQVADTEDAIICKPNAAVQLYHNNLLRLQTTSDGVQLQSNTTDAVFTLRSTAQDGAPTLRFLSDDYDDNADAWRIRADGGGDALSIQNYASGSWEKNIICRENGGVELYYDDTKRAETTNTGFNVVGALTVNGAALASGVTSDAQRNTVGGTNAGDSIASGGTDNTVFGYDAGTGITTGDFSTLAGSYAGKSLTDNNSGNFFGHRAGEYVTGHTNMGIGVYALRGTSSAAVTGSHNIAIGNSAGDAMTSGARNGLIGSSAGSAITTGIENYAFGDAALQGVTTGRYNIGIGRQTGQTITTSDYNIGIGKLATGGAGAGVTGDGNIGIGYEALKPLTSGNYNVAVGNGGAGLQITTGTYNAGIGTAALFSVTTGSHNSGLGLNACASVTTGDNNTCIGSNAGGNLSPSGSIGSSSNIVVLGNTNVTNLYCNDTSISSSDKRDKTDVTDFIHGLNWVNKLKPVSYRWDRRHWYNEYNEDGSLKTEITPDGSKKKPRQHIGFLAQDVLAIEQADGFASKKDDMLVVNLNEDDTAYGLKYERLVPVLVNAIKELSTEVNTLKTKVAALEAA